MDWQDLPPIYLVILLTLGLLAIIGFLWLLARRMLWAVHSNRLGSENDG